MLETILFSIGMVCVGIVFILGFLCTVPDSILLWAAKKDNPEWAKFMDEHQSEILRIKYRKILIESENINV